MLTNLLIWNISRYKWWPKYEQYNNKYFWMHASDWFDICLSGWWGVQGCHCMTIDLSLDDGDTVVTDWWWWHCRWWLERGGGGEKGDDDASGDDGDDGDDDISREWGRPRLHDGAKFGGTGWGPHVALCQSSSSVTASSPATNTFDNTQKG